MNLKNNSPDAALQSQNNGVVVSGRFRTGVTLKNGWGVQGGGFARGKEVQLQGSAGGFRMYDLGIKKDFKNKRGSVGLAMENFLTDALKMKTNLSSATFDQMTTMYRYNRGFRVNFSYRLGKMTFVETKSRRRKSVNNDDQKSDGGGGNDAGIQTPQATPAVTIPAGGAAGRPQGAFGNRPQGQAGSAPKTATDSTSGKSGFSTPVTVDSTSRRQPGMNIPATVDSTQRKMDTTIVQPMNVVPVVPTDSTSEKKSEIILPAGTTDSTQKKPAVIIPVTPADSTKKPE